MKNIVEWLIESKLADSGYSAAGMVNGLELNGLSDEQIEARARLYRNWRDSGIFGKRTKPCFEMAILGEDVPVICGHDTAIVIEHLPSGIIKMQCTWACQKVYYEKHNDGLSFECQPCGHPLTSIVNDDENTHYCRECAEAAQ